MPGGHVSHQIGLDADIGLDMRPRPPLRPRQRSTSTLPTMVRGDGRGVDPTAWSPRVITLLRIAAALPEVDRILVNPAIKQQLCREVTGDRTWLHLIRPWYDHAAHMHIRFRCPEGQSDCIQAPPPPPGDGCDATLQWWFDQLNAPPQPAARVTNRRQRPPPAAPSCPAAEPPPHHDQPAAQACAKPPPKSPPKTESRRQVEAKPNQSRHRTIKT